jgi:DNA-binding LytR/AlgR family response regulator
MTHDELIAKADRLDIDPYNRTMAIPMYNDITASYVIDNMKKFAEEHNISLDSIVVEVAYDTFDIAHLAYYLPMNDEEIKQAIENKKESVRYQISKLQELIED